MKENILLVDDLPENLQLLSDLLIELGYTVQIVTSGQVALKIVKVKRPDIIFLDVNMPEMDGYQVCKSLKADQELRNIPIIFISGLNDVSDQVKAFESGGVDYITKPLRVKEVVARLESQLTIQRQQRFLEQEIIKRKETEELLYQSRSMLSSLLNSSLDGIAAMEAVREPSSGEIKDFRCLVVNQILARIFERNREDMIGKLILKKLLNRIQPELFYRFVRTVETGESWGQDVYYFSIEPRWYHLISVKLWDGFAIIIRDITERKNMELNLEQANKELESFNYTVAHDLRNPLSTITSSNDLLISLYSDQLNEQGQKFLELIHKSTKRMIQIIDDLLILSQLKVSQMTITSVNLSGMVDEIITKLQFRQPGRKVELIINQNITANGDSSLLEIALENLIGNAWKYTLKKEKPQIEFGVLSMANQEHREQLSKDCQPYFSSQLETMLKPPSQLVYFVKDNGAGFDMSKAGEIFTPFKRLHTDAQFQGTGIGLSIVERIIHRHGGLIWFNSNVNNGTTFYFTVGIKLR